MTDTLTRKPLTVRGAGTPWATIRLAHSQVSEVRQVLDAHKVRYWMRGNILSIDGGPEITWIQLGRGTDAAAIQAILDSVH